MKTILISIYLLLFSLVVIAQVPQAIPYQAVARNASGNPLVNQPISVLFSIHNATAGGAIVYKENQSVTTNALGLFTANVGMGTPQIGTFSGISWATGAKYLEVAMDPAGGSSYVSMGTQQLLSVPYALQALNVTNTPTPAGTIASTFYTNGLFTPLSDNTNYQFTGPTVTATITAGQKVEVTTTCMMGTSVAGGANMTRVSIVRKSPTDPFPVDNGGDWVGGLWMPQNTRLPITLNTIFTSLPAGTYQFGFGYQGSVGQAAQWNTNDWVRISVKVINP
jgi:hypothetical protein